MFVSPGDGNSVSHWLGTCYGTQPWVNPVLAGMMQVSSFVMLQPIERSACRQAFLGENAIHGTRL